MIPNFYEASWEKFKMKLNFFALLTLLSIATFPLMGCGGGGGENTVVEAPAEDAGGAMEGISDEEYDAEMNAQMNEQQ